MIALFEGSSLIIIQANSGPKTVSRGIIIPTSAAGTCLGASVININDTVQTKHIATTYHRASIGKKIVGANISDSAADENPPTDIAGTILIALCLRIKVKLIPIIVAVDSANKSPFIFIFPKLSDITKYMPEKTTSIAIMVAIFTRSPNNNQAIIAVIMGALLIIIRVLAIEVNSKAKTKVTELSPKRNPSNIPSLPIL